MTTMPFPTTTGISAAYDQGSAQVHQHLTAALGALGQMDASVHGAIDMLNSEIAALRAFLQQAANTPGISATEALQLLQLEDAVNQAQTQTTTPAQAATASTGLRSLFNSMFGRPANTPIVPAAPVASQPAQTAPTATTPAQPAQAQPPAPAAPVATTPAAGSNTPANLWFVGAHPNPQPISPVATDAWGAQVGAALDNHRDGLNILRGEVNDINRHLGRQNGPNGPTYRPIGNGNGDYSPLIVVLCIVVGGFLGWLLGHQFLTLNWGFFGPDGGIFFGALAGAIASIWLAKKH
jgi:hypothetical protein